MKYIVNNKEVSGDLTMKLTDIEFNYIPGTDYGTGTLTVADEHDCCYFYFEFSAFQEQDFY